MSYELVAIIILVGSLLGILVILFRKIPVLVELPEERVIAQERLFFKLRERIKNSRYFRPSYFELFLQKILSKIRILTLKTENQIAIWLQKLRKKSLRKKEEKKDNYWQEIKNSAKEK